MHKLVRVLTGSEGVRSTVLVTFGNVVSTGLGAAAMIMAFRLVTPAEFGIFSAIFALMMIVVKIADMGTNVAMQKLLSQPSSEVIQRDKESVWGATFVFKILVGLTLSLLTALFSSVLSRTTHLPAGYLIIGVVAALGMIIYDHSVVTAQSLHRFGLSVGASAFQSILKILGLGIFFYLGSTTPSQLIVLYGLAPLVGSLIVPLTIKLPIGKINWSKSKNMIWHIARFSSIAILSAALADNVDILMIQSMLSAEGTGIYSAAARIAGFVSIVGYAVGVVLSVRVARYKTKEHIDLYLKKAGSLALISFLALLAAVPFAKFLIVLTAGTAYLGAVVSLQYLLVAAGIVMATSPYVALFYTFDRPSYFAVSGILIAGLLLAGNYIFIPLFGIEGAGIAKLATRVVVFLYTYLYVKKIYQNTYMTVNES